MHGISWIVFMIGCHMIIWRQDWAWPKSHYSAWESLTALRHCLYKNSIQIQYDISYIITDSSELYFWLGLQRQLVLIQDDDVENNGEWGLETTHHLFFKVQTPHSLFGDFWVRKPLQLSSSLSPSLSPCLSSNNHSWRLFPKTIEGFDCKINGQALGAVQESNRF